MSNKKLSVFISSAYKGKHMRDARSATAAAIAEAQCIPEGMELFEISNRDKWTVIQEIIDRSDLCVAILGGRYGSIAPDNAIQKAKVGGQGVGYTELEILYAQKRGIPILPFLHKSPEKMLVGEATSGETREKQKKFRAFRSRLNDGSPGYWKTSGDLCEGVKNGLRQAITTYSQRPGWVRGNRLNAAEARVTKWKNQAENSQAWGEQLEARIATLERENRELQEQLERLRTTVPWDSVRIGASTPKISTSGRLTDAIARYS